MGRLMWLPDALRAQGLDVVTVAGWELRGRDSVSPRVIVNHHTAARPPADAPSLNICTYGRTGVPGPLANILIARSGRCYVIASGVANNAGSGGWSAHQASSNSHTIGIEVENDGVGEPWNARTYDSLVRANVAICRHLGWGADRCIGHKEWAPKRKIDPTFDMGRFRQDVAGALAKATKSKEHDLTPEQNKMLHDLWTALVGQQPREGGGVHNLAYPILSTNHGIGLLLAAAGKGVDPTEIARAVVAELGEDMARDLMAAMGRVLTEASTTNS